MGDRLLAGPWLWRGIYVSAVLAMLFLRLLPLPSEAGSLPGPDLLMCLSCAWVLRRPDHLPALLIAGAVFLEDMVLMRPPGLWAAILLIGTEFLRSRAAFSRELTLLSEWFMVAIVMLGMMLAYRMINGLTMLPQPGIGFTLVQFVFSALAYPCLVGLLRLTFGLRKPAAGEVDPQGRRL